MLVLQAGNNLSHKKLSNDESTFIQARIKHLKERFIENKTGMIRSTDIFDIFS